DGIRDATVTGVQTCALPISVFLDVRMPHPDGIELARHIRSSKLNQTTPIVMITGDEDRNAMMRAFQAGATFFLSKPVDRPRLMRSEERRVGRECISRRATE